MSKIYKAEYADGEMEVFSYCDNDREAMAVKAMAVRIISSDETDR